MSPAPVIRHLSELQKHTIAEGDPVRLIYLTGPAEGSPASIYFEVWDPLGSQPFNSHPGSVEVFVILAGSGRAYCDSHAVDLVAGDVLVLPEGSSHRIENVSQTDRMYAVTVMADDAEAMQGGFAELVTRGFSQPLDQLDLATLFNH